MTPKPSTPAITQKPFRNDEDFWRVRRMLIDLHPITPTGFNWEVRRWDGWRFYGPDPAWNPRWEETVRLWETETGELVGAVHPEGRGDAHLELHPDYRRIEEEMIVWAEEHLAVPADDSGTGAKRLDTFVFEYDSARRSLLERRGYTKLDQGGVTRRLRFGDQVYPEPDLAVGYTLRTTRPGNDEDARQIADLLNASFRRDFHNPDEFRVFSTHAPCFRHDLDLVAIAPGGLFAAYVGIPWDEANRLGIFEPVCTHPDHQRKGLARSLMIEGLRRLQSLGASDVLVGTGDQIAANKLYDSLGFTETCKGYVWEKVF